MLKRMTLLVVVVSAFVLAVYAAGDRPAPDAHAEQPKIADMKFNDVVEVAPGVFFRYASISATDMSVPFGGCNNVWIVFKDYVVVIDANFPKEAGDVLAAIRKTTNKPIKYVLDTHHHGDHAYGNCIWAKEGAKIIASKNAGRLLQTSGPKQWDEAAKDRDDIKKNSLKTADITFDEKHVLDDGTQRVEFLHFGHSHTIGDAVAYLPKHKILCTGDACVNGAFNYMGHSNTASWIKCLDGMDKLDIQLICPGHGKVTGKDLLARQKRYLVELRAAVKQGIDNQKSVDEITKGLDFPWYKEWTGAGVTETPMNKNNVQHVYDELMGKIEHDRLGNKPYPLDWRTEPAIVAGR